MKFLVTPLPHRPWCFRGTSREIDREERRRRHFVMVSATSNLNQSGLAVNQYEKTPYLPDHYV